MLPAPVIQEQTMFKRLALLSGPVCVAALAVACSDVSETEPAGAVEPEQTAADDQAGIDLAEQVAKMGAIGFSYGGTFSPDGERIAFISNATGVPNVWMADAGGALVQVTRSADQVGEVRWSPAGDRLAIDIAPGGGLNSQIYLMQPDGSEMQMITAGGDVNNWLAGWSDDGRYVSYSSSAESENGMDCWLHDTETGESRLLVSNEGIGVCLLSLDNSRVLVWRMVSRGNTNLYLVELESGAEQLLTPHEGVAVSEDGLFLDDDTLVFSTNVDRETLALARIELDEGTAQPLEILIARDDAELAGMEALADGRLLLNWNAAGQSELMYFDPATGESTPGPELPAELASAPEASPDGTEVVFTVSGSATPNDVWRLEVTSDKLQKISDTPHEGVDLASLVRPELRTYSAHDGLELSGWLYRPHGQSEPGPMVLSFHGGPEGQERPRFRATYQALLGRGIAVFAPNVRGSSGFGKTFVNLDNGALRFDGIKDIEATFNYVTEAGLADPERVGIMGGSYGGYMVMAGITEYPEMFAAGANLFGIVNFETFFANTEPWMAAISTIEYGDPATEPELLKKLSPIHRIDRIVTPTIVLHGANDTNVPVVEAEQVVENLEARGVPVRYVLFDDEGHGWGKVGNRVTSDVEIVRWFHEHL
jgi:dipeptidyl aminopeptidase/acylaminoacyl peptidase